MSKTAWQGCSEHKIWREGCIDCWCPSKLPPSDITLEQAKAENRFLKEPDVIELVDALIKEARQWGTGLALNHAMRLHIDKPPGLECMKFEVGEARAALLKAIAEK